MRRIALVLFVLVAASVACSSGDTTTNENCGTANLTSGCICEDGLSQGIKTCNADGSWTVCVCGGEPDVVEDIPAEEDIQEPLPDIKVKDEAEPDPDVIPDIEPQDLPMICLLNNCTDDAHCTACSDNRHICLIDENRCVACDPNSGEGCEDGEACSGFGICVPDQLTCPTDPQTGEPTVVCQKNSDCKACSPMHQVCDTQSHKCQACTANNTSHCNPNDICKDGKCAPKCPQSCNTDNDCQFCGAPGSEAHACNNHNCSECSPTWPCPSDMVCLANGVCYPPCGVPGPVSGSCKSDKDCYWCGDPKTPGVFECKFPVNDPAHGSCAPPAEGCEDLGVGIAVLPEPWSDYTQLCSTDANCSDVGITLNVGKLIKDAAGVSEVMGISIGDANVTYGMGKCASINITGDIDCGVCVPCAVDEDCQTIPVDPLIVDLFAGTPLAQIAGTLLISMLYGDETAHDLHFYCQPIGLGYGVCAPCSNPLQKCGSGSSGGSGNCDHDVCTAGDALDPSCGACAETVCGYDNYCCEEAWDDVCVAAVDQYCATSCSGEGGCATDICTNSALDAQDASCGPCVAAVCEADSFCCNKQGGSWDDLCMNAALENPACDALCGGGGGCAHSECEAGGPLATDCSACATAVCGYDDWCCSNEWDSICVEEAEADEACDCP